MAKIFKLPAVGDTMVEGEIVGWLVAVGDVVDLDQPICDIETDKSVVQMTTPYRGTVLQLGAEVGGVVEVGAPLIIVGEPGEAIPEIEASPTPSAVSNPAPAAATATSSPSSWPATAGTTAAVGSKPAPVISPMLRRFAEEEGVVLAGVQGTGPGGRITRADIASAAAGVSLAPTVAASPSGSILALPKVRKYAREAGFDLAEAVGTGPRGSITLADLPALAPVRGRRVRMSAMRRSIAKNLTASAQQIPQFTSMVDFEATALLTRRAALRESLDMPVPVDTLLMSCLVEVLADHPLMNAQLLEEEIEYFDDLDIGVAVDTPDGLMVPVVRGADRLEIGDLASEIVRLASAARDRKITPDELTGGTCTVNNVGALGILAGTPILPLGTSTIVAFGASRPTPRIRDGELVEVPIATISATFDHRLIDGGDSARFLKDLAAKLESVEGSG